ncbi:MAG TPA: hypothetical protein VM390_02025 [Acidimicrobiales bacterium]|nr:hypothetical protein [Acidimicrobiales bacterium]
MRPVLAVLAAAAVASLQAVILGEYPFEGVTVLAAAVVFGLFVAEAARAVARQAGLVLGLACAALTLAAMVWSAWIATGHDLSFLGPAGWAAIPLAAATAGLRAGRPRLLRERTSRPAAGTPTRPAPAPSPEDSPA